MTFHVTQHLFRNVQIVEVFSDDDQLLATITPGGDDGSLHVVSKHLERVDHADGDPPAAIVKFRRVVCGVVWFPVGANVTVGCELPPGHSGAHRSAESTWDPSE